MNLIEVDVLPSRADICCRMYIALLLLAMVRVCVRDLRNPDRQIYYLPPFTSLCTAGRALIGILTFMPCQQQQHQQRR